ncbi:MAG TPA: type II secretion system F family protein [Xanthobacteraceae bacterium]|nr:type II secretion system F family protein [Xanthobacteraceae bacterium]
MHQPAHGQPRDPRRPQHDRGARASRRPPGLEEARSFATLIQQSAELGSSITDALRVYSDDMRHKRLSLAEEKAYSLPAKLAIPMMVCIFPVLFVVILLPVAVRLYTGHY